MTDKTQPEALALADELRQLMSPDVIKLWAAEAAGMIRRQHARIAELEAARFAYASEFEPNSDGYPDVGSIHANIRALKAKLASIGAGGVQALSAAPAVPAGWKAVPVNPTPEMWKAAKTVPDPNPPYPPHYGLVWDAMLAASPTPPAEQQAQPDECFPGEPKVAVPQGLISAACFAIRKKRDGGKVLEQLRRYSVGDRSQPLAPQQAAPKAAPGDVLDESLRERDDAEDFIDALLDEVLGHERPEWSSSYGRADALNDVQERMTALHKPAVDKAWGQFQSAMAAPQQEPAPLSDDTKRLDWLDRNIFSREMSEWDAKYGHGPDYNMWVVFSPKGVQGSARNIIDAALAAQRDTP